MSHDELRHRLDDFVEGTLTSEEHAAVARHLDRCADCRAEVDALRGLLEDVRRLPRRIAPPDDLWEEIEPRLDAPRPATPLHRRRASALAAAAVLLVAAGIGIGRSLGRESPAELPAALLRAEAQRTEEVYRRAAAELEQALAGPEAQLAPQTAETIARNLAVIDSAIAEIQAALRRDAGSAALLDMLSARYRDRLEVLQQAVRLTARL